MRANAADTQIVLIDEPGLYLHAKAQEDVLRVLESISKSCGVVFSTHSPYLIDTDRLDRIRLVSKSSVKGTSIENKIHSGSDLETLTPIVTAIGLAVNGDFPFIGGQNIILEGISDYFYLVAMKSLLAPDLNVKFVPSVGAPKIPQIVSLLIAWGLSYSVILDSDREGRRTAKVLEEKLSVSTKSIIFVSDSDGLSMEDMFSRDDFCNHVIVEESYPESRVANSKIVKDRKLDKVLLSKRFMDKVMDAKGANRIFSLY